MSSHRRVWASERVDVDTEQPGGGAPRDVLPLLTLEVKDKAREVVHELRQHRQTELSVDLVGVGHLRVDVGGDGITPVAKTPSWATAKDRAGIKTSALSSPPAQPSEQPAHDHRWGVGRMTLDTARFQQLVNDGVITRKVLQQALDQLRYMGR